MQESDGHSDLIGHYEIKEKIAEGGFGVVYIGKDTRLHREVAIKVLHAYHASEPTRVARFMREAQSAAKLNHPGIVQVYDIVESGERMALVMEYVRGENLDRYLKTHLQLSLADKVEIGAQIGETLHAAHQTGIIHRDVKPANVMMDEYGRVKLTDFSLARLVDNSLTPLTGENNVLGTPAYMSPEQCLGYEATPQSDIYSLGVILYEMATGNPLFEAENYLALMRHHTDTPPTPIRLVQPNLPVALERLIMSCLSKLPEKRPASANEVAQNLRSIDLTPQHNLLDPSISKTIAINLDEVAQTPSPSSGGSVSSIELLSPPEPGLPLPAGTNSSGHSLPPGGTPQPVQREVTPQPMASGMTPQPIAPGMTPQPIAPGMTPQPIAPGMTPQPMAPGMTPQPMAPGMTPQPMAPLDAKKARWRSVLPWALGSVILLLLGIVAGLIINRPEPQQAPALQVSPPPTAADPAEAARLANIVGEGPLATYVRKADDNFSYKLHSEIQGEGYQAYILDMVSQTWHADKTAPPVWRHWVTIVKPEKVTTDTALLVFSNGFSTPDKPLEEVPVLLLALALTTKSVVAIVEGFPRDPVGFQDDIDNPEAVEQNEFAVMSFLRYLDTEDPSWPIVCPMVKSAVRSMDCVQEYLYQELTPPLEVRRFVLTGEANGWGTWLTGAIDTRVAAIAPVQFDLLNISAQIKHQVGGRGEMSPFLSLFSDLDLLPALDTPAGKELLRLIDPVLYRNRLNIPKLLLLPGHNPYATVDASNLYCDELEGETALFCAPNITLTRNNPFLPQQGRQAVSPSAPDQIEYSSQDFRDTLQVFYHRVLVNKPMPRFSWHFEEDGSYEIVAEEAPTEVLLWLAQVEDREDLYQQDTLTPWKMERLSETGYGAYQGRVILEEQLLTVFYIEMVYPSMLGLNFSLTTPTQLLASPEKPKTLTQPSMGYPGNVYPRSSYPSTAPYGNTPSTYSTPAPQTASPYSSPGYPGYGAPVTAQQSQTQPTAPGYESSAEWARQNPGYSSGSADYYQPPQASRTRGYEGAGAAMNPSAQGSQAGAAPVAGQGAYNAPPPRQGASGYGYSAPPQRSRDEAEFEAGRTRPE